MFRANASKSSAFTERRTPSSSAVAARTVDGDAVGGRSSIHICVKKVSKSEGK